MVSKLFTFGSFDDDEGRRREQVTNFIGDFTAFERVPEEESRKARLKFGFTDIEVITADPPYDYSTYEFTVGESLTSKGNIRRNSGEGIIVASIKELLNVAPDEVVTVEDIMGLRVHMMCDPDYLFFVDKNKRENRGAAWQFIEVVGGNISTRAYAVMQLQGKTTKEWWVTISGDPRVIKDAAVFGELLDNTIPDKLPSAIAVMGADGRWTVNEEEASKL
ncbi:hypothetical protein HYZ97_02380 [Candidatus Pacearchaeota archaeon]|nr:hypothetical protein [Candidatus Pacearchaeota archaeon]